MPADGLGASWAPARTELLQETRRRLVLSFAAGAAILALFALPLFWFGLLDLGSPYSAAMNWVILVGGTCQALVCLWVLSGRSVQAAGFATVTIIGVSCIAAALLLNQDVVLCISALMFLAVPIMLSGSVLDPTFVQTATGLAAVSTLGAGWLLYPVYGIAILVAPTLAILAGSFIVHTNSSVAFDMDARDVAHRVHERRLELEASTDALTGLLNRRGFFLAAGSELSLARRQGVGIALVYLDLDGMKSINDTYGHLEGDEALRNAASLLRASLRSSDLVGRIGGDEFAVFAWQTPGAEIERFPARLEAAMKQHNAGNSGCAPVVLSYGMVYAASDDQRPLEHLLRAADDLMYEAKAESRQGRIG